MYWCSRLVPAFCSRYLGAGAAGVRRACLSLVRKMVHYAPARLLRDMSRARSPNTAALLTQLVAAVLDNVVRTHLGLLIREQHKNYRYIHLVKAKMLVLNEAQGFRCA